jgi:cyclophilin family peptidyl-prolyl cis-trans isomerase
MKKIIIILLFEMLLIAQSLQCQEKEFLMPDGVSAVFNTNKGRIVVLLDYRNTPMTVANFVGLAEGTISNSTYPEGKPFYNGSIWHRVVKGHVIQGGEPSVVADPANKEESSTGYEIPNEISGLSHNKAGMIGMANAGPHTNTCQYYITLGDRSYLDGNYTLFGEVVDGMDIVNSIEQGDTTFTISIVRKGDEASRFMVNDEIFRELVEKQQKIVILEKELRMARDEKFISDKFPGLTSLPSGLRYKIEVHGKGNYPVEGSVLSVCYEGILTNCVRFVSSSEGMPMDGSDSQSFFHTLGKEGLVRGLELGLRDMKSGERRVLVIPPELGYGINSAFYGKEIPGKKRFVISPGDILILTVTLNKLN